MSEAKKYDMNSIVDNLRKKFNDPKKANKIGTGNNLLQLGPEDFIKMPDWWQQSTGTYGMPFGRMVLLAGNSDSGKTAIAIQSIKAALDQGCGVIYAETENKTNEQDFIRWGVDPTQIMVIQSSIAEELYEYMFSMWEAFRAEYPDSPLFVVIDSLGNMLSLRDSDIDLTEQSSQPGGKGKINRLGLNKMLSKMHEDNAAVLLISYTYDNMGSPGKTNAGGNALNFFSSLTYQTARKGWVEKTVKGEKQRIGADVTLKLFKNHINRENPGDKVINLRITNGGIEYMSGKKTDENESD